MPQFALLTSEANLVESYDDREEAMAALRQIAEAEPETADEYAVIEYDDETGHPVGEAITGSALVAHG